MTQLYKNKWVILSLIVPALLTFLFAVIMPIFMSAYYSMTSFSGLGSADYIGADNYKELLKDDVFWLSLRNSLFLALGFICIQHPLAILTATTLDRLRGKAEGFFRCIYFIPNVISVAVIAYLWKFIYNPNFGLLAKLLGAFGNTEPINWMGSGTAIWAVLITLVWHGFGWGFLIYYAGVKGIDPTLYEAASIDGANWWQSLLHITLPQMKPVIQVNVTLAVIAALKQMETVYLLTGGGPGNETQFMATYLYTQAFKSFRYGYGNSISVVYVIICLVATLVLNRLFAERERGKRGGKRDLT